MVSHYLQKCMTRTSSDNSGQQLHRTFLTSSRSLHPKFLSSLSKVNNTYSGGSSGVSDLPLTYMYKPTALLSP